MSLHLFDDISLEIDAGPAAGAELAALLQDLCWRPSPAPVEEPALVVNIRESGGSGLPDSGITTFHADGFRGLEDGPDFYLGFGDSVFRITGRRAEAKLGADFASKPDRARRNFWAFGVIKLLRSLGLFVLHGAGLVSPAGTAWLLVGPSGSGKSTLTLDLLRKGWSFLSDDAVLVGKRSDGIVALGSRRNLAIEASAVDQHPDLELTEEAFETSTKQKRRVRADESFPRQRVASCRPELLLFPRVEADAPTALEPLSAVDALARLLEQSGPELFGRDTMEQHVRVLGALLQQAPPLALRSGSDLRGRPELLEELLAGLRHAGN